MNHANNNVNRIELIILALYMVLHVGIYDPFVQTFYVNLTFCMRLSMLTIDFIAKCSANAPANLITFTCVIYYPNTMLFYIWIEFFLRSLSFSLSLSVSLSLCPPSRLFFSTFSSVYSPFHRLCMRVRFLLQALFNI